MTEQLTVIYNDTCPICAREVRGYKRMTERHDLPIRFRGLSEGELDAYGLSKRAAARRFHVEENGRVYDGVDAFARVWDRILRLRWLARLVRLPGLHKLSELLYDYVAAPALLRFIGDASARATRTVAASAENGFRRCDPGLGSGHVQHRARIRRYGRHAGR